MNRVEIVLSQAIDEDFITFCEDKGVAKSFTKIPTALGRGYSSPKMGDNVWPQFNCMYIIYCEESEAQMLQNIVSILQREHPEEGIACFLS